MFAQDMKASSQFYHFDVIHVMIIYIYALIVNASTFFRQNTMQDTFVGSNNKKGTAFAKTSSPLLKMTEVGRETQTMEHLLPGSIPRLLGTCFPGNQHCFKGSHQPLSNPKDEYSNDLKKCIKAGRFVRFP